MKGFITLLFFCCAVSAWTASNNRLNNGDLAYYGEDFYRRAWEDGYSTHASDAFHGKTTPFDKSDFYKEIK